MPIKVPDKLPAVEILEDENVFVMKESRAYTQDIRALKIVILNLMPLKKITETQILRLLGNTPLQVDIVLLHPETHESKNTSQDHLSNFYKTFAEIKDRKFDGMIITGAPVERLEFDKVDYWDELQEIMSWSKRNVTSTLHICWGAQAGLYHHFDVPKYQLDKKKFGVFSHQLKQNNVKLLRGLNDVFYAPHSRHTEVRREDIEEVEELDILAESEKAGVHIVATKDGRQVFVTGHPEYDRDTLKKEYERDLKKGLDIEMPVNYFPDDDSGKKPVVKWKSHAYLLFNNWLNYNVYQVTPYNLEEIK